MLKQSAKLAKSEEAIKYYNNGNNFYDLDKYEDAIKEYNKAISLNLDEDILFYKKGNSLAFLGRYEEAIIAYDKAIRLNPNYVEAINNKSMVIQKLGSEGDAKCM